MVIAAYAVWRKMQAAGVHLVPTYLPNQFMTWYRTYDVIDVILLSSKSAVWTTDSTEVGRGIYCFDKIKYKHVCNVDCVY